MFFVVNEMEIKRYLYVFGVFDLSIRYFEKCDMIFVKFQL